MTLVLALAGADGAVLVADGQATSGKKGEMLTRTPAEKLGILNGRIGYGMAGSAGLRQRVVASLEARLEKVDLGQPIATLRPLLHRAVNVVQQEAERECVRLTAFAEAAGIQVLFAGVPDEGRHWIYDVTDEGHDELHHRVEAIGSGRPYARYAVVSAGHYDLHERGLRQVLLLGFRTVKDAIQTDANALGDPISLMQVTRDGARRILDEDLTLIEATVQAWQEHERTIFDQLASKPETPDTAARIPAKEGIEVPTDTEDKTPAEPPGEEQA